MKSIAKVILTAGRRQSSSLSSSCSSRQPAAAALSAHFDLTLSQQELQQRARDFSEQRVAPLADRYDAAMQYPVEAVAGAWTAGLSPFSAAAGPHGLLEEAVVGEELAAGCASVFTALAHTNTAGAILKKHGSPYIQEKYVNLLQQSPIAAAFSASTGPAGTVVAARRGDDYVLTSSPAAESAAVHVDNAAWASFYLVVAREEEGGAYTAFVVDKHWLGVNVGPRLAPRGQRCRDVRRLALSGVTVPAAHVVGEPGGGGAVAADLSARNNLMAAAGCVGLSRAAVHVLLRQGLRLDHPVLLRMLTRVEAARLVTRKVCVCADRGHDSGLTSRMALTQALDAARHNTLQAAQTVGRSDDSSLVAKLLRDVGVWEDANR